MAIKLKGGVGPVVRGASVSDTGITVTHNKVSIQVSGGTVTQETRQDAVVNVYTSASYYEGGSISVSGVVGSRLVSRNTSIGNFGNDGSIIRNSSGVLDYWVEFGNITLFRSLDLTTQTGAQQPTTLANTVVGSLAQHCQQQIDNRISSSMTMASNGSLFSVQDHATATYTRNPALWCADVDLTCISPWNSDSQNRKAGTLITPRHILNAAHYEFPVGTAVRFVAADNTVLTRQVIGRRRHPRFVPNWPDLTVYTLDSDLPASIKPCKVMPANWKNYLVQNTYNRPPALGLDQEKKALIIDMISGGPSASSTVVDWLTFATPTSSNRLIFNENKISGDSGSPSFLIVNGELVLLTVWNSGGAGTGTPVAGFISDLNQMIADCDDSAGVTGAVSDPTWPNAAGHYQLLSASFAGFPTYA